MAIWTVRDVLVDVIETGLGVFEVFRAAIGLRPRRPGPRLGAFEAVTGLGREEQEIVASPRVVSSHASPFQMLQSQSELEIHAFFAMDELGCYPAISLRKPRENCG
jgi:hypothetical protein